MKDWGIRARMTAHFLAVAALTALVGLCGIFGFWQLNVSSDSINKHTTDRDAAGHVNIFVPRQFAAYCTLTLNMSDSSKAQEIYRQIRATEVEIQEKLDFLSTSLDQQELLQDYNTIRNFYFSDWLTLCRQLEQAVDAQSISECDVILAQMSSLAGDLEDTVNILFSKINAQLDAQLHYSSQLRYSLIVVFAAVILLSLITAVVQGNRVAARIANPIRKMAQAAERLSKGDIVVDLDIKTDGELAILAQALRDMVHGFRTQAEVVQTLSTGDYTVQIPLRSQDDVTNHALTRLTTEVVHSMRDLYRASGQVASGASQIAVSAQNLASGASQQAAGVDAILRSINNLQEKTKQNAESTDSANQANKQTIDTFHQSIGTMSQLLQAMQAIDESSQRITRIIKVIEDIAFQTNILALNAAVEAARAGQQGKGFAVVADEVRNLATKSAEAARETASLIASSSSSIEEGNRLVETANQMFQQALTYSADSTQLLDLVAVESQVQTDRIKEVGRQIDQISKVVQNSASTAEEMAVAAEQMSSQSDKMDEIVRRFKIGSPTADEPEELCYEEIPPLDQQSFSLRPMR